MAETTLARLTSGACRTEAQPAVTGRLRTMVDVHFDRVGRLLRGLGVPEAEVDDATQQVFIVAARRIGAIAPGRERAFLYRTAMNVAAHARRTMARRRERVDEPAEWLAPAPTPEELVAERRAREHLQRILDAMAVELRTVLVLSEGQQKGSHPFSDGDVCLD
jgi:RNA polymerase sigma-70 factor (ECF subfamily)